MRRIGAGLRVNLLVVALVAAVGVPVAHADPPGPTLTFLPFPGGIKVNITDKSGSTSTCTYTSDWFTAPPFLLGANDTHPLVLPSIENGHTWSVDVDCDNGAHTHTTYTTNGQPGTSDGPGGTPVTDAPTSFGPVSTVTDSTFAGDVLGASHPTLVAFQKPTCVDCTNFDPVLSDVAAELPIQVFTLDAEQNPSTPETFGVITPPCPDCGTFISPLVVVFKGGDVAEKIKIKKPDGSLLTKQELEERLTPHLG